jgi:hypothetical protein
MVIFRSIPQRLHLIYLLGYADWLVIMNVIFIHAFLAIVRLGLILGTVFYFAEVDHLISATRALRHDFDLVVVSH